MLILHLTACVVGCMQKALSTSPTHTLRAFYSQALLELDSAASCTLHPEAVSDSRSQHRSVFAQL